MELTQERYGISISVPRRPDEGTPRFQMKRAFRPPSPEQRREVDKEYLLASGSRYVAPFR